MDTLSALKELLAVQQRQGRTIGLVPTMGNLHAGHVSLVTAAKAQCDFVIATIFVNPLQFGPNEDLARYPRTLDADKVALTQAGCDAVFTPAVAELYPWGLKQQTLISVPHLSTLYCGKSRPGHFDGVCTIVCKLFNMTQPDVAFFGLKDFQQFFIISRMVADLQMPLRLVGLPTVREASGLAMSSRNGFLSTEQRSQATAIHATLQQVAQQIGNGERDFPQLEQFACTQLHAAGLRPDYFHVADRTTLLPATSLSQQLVLLTAAYAGQTRLIDNVTVEAPSTG
ncbi:MAG: pantoate--beta-alanine ligase [Pseudomonadota bacterium]